MAWQTVGTVHMKRCLTTTLLSSPSTPSLPSAMSTNLELDALKSQSPVDLEQGKRESPVDLQCRYPLIVLQLSLYQSVIRQAA